MKKPTLDFEPLFYIMDRSCKWVMAVREYDWNKSGNFFYAFKGAYIAWQGEINEWQVWPAYMNKQDLAEYPTNYDLTKNYDEALAWAVDNSRFPPVKEKATIYKLGLKILRTNPNRRTRPKNGGGFTKPNCLLRLCY